MTKAVEMTGEEIQAMFDRLGFQLQWTTVGTFELCDHDGWYICTLNEDDVESFIEACIGIEKLDTPERWNKLRFMKLFMRDTSRG